MSEAGNPQKYSALSLVMPAYNEAECIQEAIREADEALSCIVDEYEIIIIDDGSKDGTGDCVERTTCPKVRLLRHPVNRGYGAALRTGFEAARHERVAFTDSDCQFDLTDLALLLRIAERVPIAVGYRLQRRDIWRRRFFSWGYNLLTRVFLGIRLRDCDCALKVFHRNALLSLLPYSQGFFVNTEMLTRARLRGYAVEEVGVRHLARFGGISKVSLRDIPHTLGHFIPFWWRHIVRGKPL